MTGDTHWRPLKDLIDDVDIKKADLIFARVRALEILRQAERERKESREREAKVGIQYD